MYFKVKEGTKSFKKLMELKEKMKVCHKASLDLAIQLSGDEKGTYLGGGFNVMSGGISGLKFDKKPKGWIKASKNHTNMYFPQKNLKENKEILDKIAALPKVYRDDFNKVVSFEEQQVERHYIFMPTFYWNDDLIVFAVKEGAEYTGNSDLEELTGSEFEKYKKICEE